MSGKTGETFRVLTFNVAAARRDEEHEETKMDVRFGKIFSVIQAADADIVCLQELRTLETSRYGVKDFVTGLMDLGYDVAYEYYTPRKSSFALAIAYRRDKFFPSYLKKYTYHAVSGENPGAESNLIYFGIRFRDVRGPGAPSFWIFSTHLAMEEGRKWEAVNKLKKRFLADTWTEPFLIAGDYNFFDDRDGGAQRTALLSHGLTDLAHPVSTPDGSVLSGTFIGFDHDEHKCAPEAMSRLDHVFARGIERVGPSATAVGVTLDVLARRTYASDHLAIAIDCRIAASKESAFSTWIMSKW